MARDQILLIELVEAAVGPELADHAGHLHKGHCEYQRHNAVRIGLEGNVGALAAVHLAAYYALGILHRDAANRTVYRHHARHHDQNEHDQHGQYPPLIGPQHHVGYHGHYYLRYGGYYGSKDYEGNTVANALIGYPFAQPYQEGGACRADDADGSIGKEAGVGNDLRLILQAGYNTDALHQSETDTGVAGNALELFTAIFLLGHLLQRWDSNG